MRCRHPSKRIFLLLLDTSLPASLRRFNTLLVSFNLALLHAPKQTSTCFPRPLEVSLGRFSQEVDLGQLRLKNTLQWDDALDEQGIRVLEIQVHDTHHADAHELGPDQGTQLLVVVRLD